MRIDGQQTRQRLLDAAEDLFAQHGTSVNVAEIVAAAGVAAPTLYRHFGDKEGLIRALGERAYEVALARLGRALTRPTAWEGLQVALAGSIKLAGSHVTSRTRSGTTMSPALEKVLMYGWEELVKRAHEEGSVRADFTAADVPFLFAAAAGVAAAAHFDPVLVERYSAMLMHGLRPSEDALPGRAPALTDIRRAFG